MKKYHYFQLAFSKKTPYLLKKSVPQTIYLRAVTFHETMYEGNKRFKFQYTQLYFKTKKFEFQVTL